MNGVAEKALADSDIVELLRIGPIGGADLTTAPRYIAPTQLAASQNFTLNTEYGSLVTTLGRINALAANLPGTVTGIECLSLPGQPNLYIFAVTNAGVGQLWASYLGGVPYQLTLPTVPSTGATHLTGGLQTYFAKLGQWIFLTNGTDTPLKLTQATPSTSSTTITGNGTIGDTATIVFNLNGVLATVQIGPLLSTGTSAAEIATALAAQINAQQPFGVTASISGTATLNFFCSTGSNALTWSYSNDSGATFTPASGTFSGGSAVPVVTQWGIVKPNAAPTLTGANNGGLTIGGIYYYCVTYGTTLQESSQGVISQPITLTNTPSTATSTITGAGVAGDQYVISFFAGSVRYNFGVTLTAAATAAQLAALIASASTTSNLPAQYSVTAVGATLTFNDASGQNRTVFGITAFLQAGSTIAFSSYSGAITGGTVQQTVNLTGIPTSPDTQVTERNIYRLGGALGQWRLVGTLYDNTTTTFTDTLADTAVTGQSLTIFRDPPPPFNAIAVFQNCVFGFGTPSDLGSLWFSNYNEPWGFNGNTGYLECASSVFDDAAVALISLGSVLLCLKKRSTFLCYGNTAATFQTYFGFPIGCTSARSAAASFGTGFWESRQGIFFYNGGGFDPIANNLSRGQFQKSNIKSFLDGLAAADRAVSCGFMYDSMYHISFPTQGVTWFWDLGSQQWDSLSMFTGVAWYDQEDQVDLIAANYGTAGEVDEWFESGTDLGSPVTATLSSQVTNCGNASSVKRAAFVTVEAPLVAGATLTVTFILNPGPSQVVLTPLVFNLDGGVIGTHIQDVPLNEFFTLQVTASLSTSTQTRVDSIKVTGFVVRQEPDTAVEAFA